LGEQIETFVYAIPPSLFGADHDGHTPDDPPRGALDRMSLGIQTCDHCLGGARRG
jgi:hypothetical protein